MNRQKINVNVKNSQETIQVSKEDGIWYDIKEITDDKEGNGEKNKAK